MTTQIVDTKASTNGALATGGMTPTVASLLDKALASGLTAEAMAKFVELCERMSDRAAAQEFAEAMARFQEHCPPIRKTSTAKIVTSSGSSYGYNYAELDTIANTVRPLLAKEGLSYSWDSSEDGAKLVCTCTVRHVNGHKVSSHFTCAIDTTAKMSGAQKSGAALTYARRQALVQVLGLTTCDKDSDAGMMPPDNSGEKINQDQADEISILLAETGSDKARFLKWAGVESIADIPERRYAEIVASINAKRRPK